MTAKFAKFEVLSWYGSGGGLNYFKVKKSGEYGKPQKTHFLNTLF